ncbi:tail fiber protein [Bdellovibrio bacteriovorus]|uniref:Tail Collar domain protein n=1 Tax=Bdellovibrio bacteriovorus str. Tiberius TaxID=1069642 RepID=K7YRB2_BDEBC|nr:tail fiber protein [Bdellovibrio bacteriovorus]AFY02396.1 Tail Collar domain protein [Bdellovibrio bacteriovorus str. Tiberius]
MKKFTLVLALLTLSLTVKAQARELECGMSEVRAFNSAVTPDENAWTKADGRLMRITMNQALFALLGVQYGGDYRQTFALPKIEDIQLNGQSYSYYICVRGIWPSGGTDSANTGFMRQYAGNFNLDSYNERMLIREEALPIERYPALASILNRDLVQDNSVLMPTVTLPAVLKNVPTGTELNNILEVNGNYPAYQIACEKGGVYFALGKMREPENAKEIIVEGMAGISFGGVTKEAAHMYECL